MRYQAQIPEDEFWGMSWEEFWLAIEAYERREYRADVRMREIVLMQYNTHAKKGHRKTAREFMPLLYDAIQQATGNLRKAKAMFKRNLHNIKKHLGIKDG